jgi:hypothetical protein
MEKKHEGPNVKARNEFGNDQMKIDHKMKNIKIVFLSHRLWFFMKHFFH